MNVTILLMASAPMLYGWSAGVRMVNGGISATSSTETAVHCMLIGGVLAVAWYGLCALRNRLISVSIIGAMVGLYLTYAAFDHLSFFRGDKAGTVAVEYFTEYSKIRDMKCPRPTLLVRDIGSETVTYRCPHNVLLGNFTAQPFAPWPSYTEGRSRDLAAAIASLEASAKLR